MMINIRFSNRALASLGLGIPNEQAETSDEARCTLIVPK